LQAEVVVHPKATSYFAKIWRDLIDETRPRLVADPFEVKLSPPGRWMEEGKSSGPGIEVFPRMVWMEVGLLERLWPESKGRLAPAGVAGAERPFLLMRVEV
jgi:hypothetical protein